MFPWQVTSSKALKALLEERLSLNISNHSLCLERLDGSLVRVDLI